jgi:hypothetical protein
MNKSTAMAAAIAAAAMVIVGCASSGASKPEAKKTDGVQAEFDKWASKRTPTEMVVSKCADPDVAAIVNGVAVIPGEVYGYLAGGADKAMARNAGRDIAKAVENEVRAGMSRAEAEAKIPAGDRPAYDEYQKYYGSQDYVALGTKLAGIAAKLASDGTKVAGAINEIKNLDSMKNKSAMALAMAMREPTAEVNTIKAQLADAVKACTYWQDLNKQDEQMKKFAQEYPVEK